MNETVREASNEAAACEHCGGLVYEDTLRCPQCRKFPKKLHVCPRCKCISAASESSCWKCGHRFAPGGDYL